jgi:uncharacterized protein (TIGR00251 family)
VSSLLAEVDGGVRISVKVHPRAKTDAITGVVGEALKLSLTAPPVDGRANEACIAFFAKFFSVPRASVTIAAGAGSRNKVLLVTGISKAVAEERLHVALQDL